MKQIYKTIANKYESGNMHEDWSDCYKDLNIYEYIEDIFNAIGDNFVGNACVVYIVLLYSPYSKYVKNNLQEAREYLFEKIFNPDRQDQEFIRIARQIIYLNTSEAIPLIKLLFSGEYGSIILEYIAAKSARDSLLFVLLSGIDFNVDSETMLAKVTTIKQAAAALASINPLVSAAHTTWNNVFFKDLVEEVEQQKNVRKFNYENEIKSNEDQ